MIKPTNDNTRAPAGWTIDGHGWLVRAMRPGEMEVNDPRFGFTIEGVIFVRNPECCHNYDRGVIPREASSCSN